MVRYRDRDGNQNERLTGCEGGIGPGPNGEIVVQPLKFLGGTVLSFNASLGIGPIEESTLNVQVINDCKVPGADNPAAPPNGDYFYGQAKLGGAVFFDTGLAFNLAPGGDVGRFKFGGILTSYDVNSSSAGQIFNARIVDPRMLLDHAIVIVDSYLEGPVKHRNYFNAYAFYEYNILPTGIKLDSPTPTGVPETGVLYAQQEEQNKGLVYEPFESAWTPLDLPGSESGGDCSVFGTSDRNDQGMNARKVLQAIKAMNPLIFSPNYGEPYNPLLTNKDIIAAAGKFHHELNVFRLDMSGFPEPPPYMRIAGPSITILELLTQICDIRGDHFNVKLVESEVNGQPHVIKIETRHIDGNQENPQLIRDEILRFNGVATDLTFGEELITEKSRTILLGEQEHILVESSDLQFFFGEDDNGDAIVPVLNRPSGCGFEVAFDVRELNSMLTCPLFDPREHDSGGPIVEQLLDKRIVVSEADLRAILSSEDLWKIRIAADNPDYKTLYPDTQEGLAEKAIDFNLVLRYNFQDILSPLIHEILARVGFNSDQLRDQLFVEENEAKAAIDAVSVTDARYIHNITDIRKKDLNTVYDWLHDIANTFYGKQYIVTLPTGVCAIPAGLYDENYFGMSDDPEAVFPPAIQEFIDIECREVIPPNDPRLRNKIFRPTMYSHVPTNEGGWAEPCIPVLGLDDEDLTFFRTDDFRVGSFSRFESKDIIVNYNGGIVGTTDLAPPGPGLTVLINNTNQTLVSEDGENQQPTSFTIEGVCGEIDISQHSPDTYLIKREFGGNCGQPLNGLDQDGKIENYGILDNPDSFQAIPLKEVPEGDLEYNLWISCSVDEKLYIVKNTDCPEGSDCPDVAKAVIKFDAPCLKKPCGKNSQEYVHDILLNTLSNANLLKEGVLEKAEEKTGDEEVVPKEKTTRDNTMEFVCGIPVESGLYLLSSALDSSSINNKGFHPAASLPTAVCIPLKSNISAYGPWYSSNFNDSAGGIDFRRDNDLAPWNYSSAKVLNYIAEQILKEAQVNKSESEKGSITYPGPPLLNLGFAENIPNLTAVNVNWSSQGISTNYEFQTYTPKFGGLKTLEAKQVRETVANRQKAEKIIRDRIVTKNRTQRKLFNFGRNNSGPRPGDRGTSDDKGTLQRIMMGEMYDFSLLREHTDPVSGVIIGSGQRVVVGTDSLQKSQLEMRFGYENKAYMSLDGLFSPVTISGSTSGCGLPMFAVKYTGYLDAFESTSISPNPPVFTTGNIGGIVVSGVSGINISQEYLNPLQNAFGDGKHPQHSGGGAGHCVDVVGRGTGIPTSGNLMSLYPQKDWKNRYSDDYRFLGLRGPLVLHSWGYDTDGKPIPNIVDKESDIKASGNFANSGLHDYFLQDWLHKPNTWPVAPIDLRFDRERGVWVSPPQHKIVVAETKTSIPEYGSGSGVLINEKDNKDYGKDIYDKNGNLVMASGDDSQANIMIEDRLGVNTEAGTRSYAYFDTFTSSYLLLGGGVAASPIKLGKYNGYWSNAHGKNIKTVTLYEQPERASDPFDWVPQENPDGTPKTVIALNLFAYLPSKFGSDRSLWCSVVKIGDKKGYYNNQEYNELYLLLAAEC